MHAISIRSALRTGALLCPALFMSSVVFGQSAKSVITFDPQPPRKAASTPLLGLTGAFAQSTPKPVISLDASRRPNVMTMAPGRDADLLANASPNVYVFGSAKVGERADIEQIRLRFSATTQLTKIESKSRQFAIEPGGTCVEGNSYSAGDVCIVLARFKPQGAGHRGGYLQITHSAESTALYVGLTGNGYAPAISFTPAQISTVPASISGGAGTISATNLAIDGGDILYIADTGNNLVKKMDSTGAIVNSVNSPIATPASIAADSFGILYTSNVPGSTYYFSVYYPWGSETAFGYAHTAGTCTPSTPCPLSTVGMSSPANMSMDAYDNLFFEEGTKGAAEMPVASISGGSGAFNLWYLSDQFAYSSGSPGSFAVDANGNLYTDYNFTSSGVCYLLEEPLYNAENAPTANRVAGGVKCGFSGDGGQARSAEISSTIGQIAFDIAGNLYFADAGNQRVRRIDATTGVISTIAGTGTAGYTNDGGQATTARLNGPTGVAVDSQGQVYIISGTASAASPQLIRKLGPNGFLQFGSQSTSGTSTAHVVTVSNTGNSAMTLTKEVINGTNAGDFSIDPNTTNCNLVTGMVLNSGQSCKIGVLFKPSATGARSANIVLIDNTVNGSNTVQLAGTGVTGAVILNSPQRLPRSVPPVSSLPRVTPVSRPATAGTVKPTVGGEQIGSPLSSGAISVNVKKTTNAGAPTVTAISNEDVSDASDDQSNERSRW